MKVPFNRPYLPHDAFVFMQDAAFVRQQLSGDGYYTRLCEQWMQTRIGAERVLLVNSCTSALEMALLLLDVGPGDEVVLPSFTFVSCASVVVLRGATPVFADIDEQTLSISPATVEPCLTSRTKVVLAVHYGATGRDARAIADLCASRGIDLVEDAAHAFLGEIDGRPLGTFGRLGAFSFHETKNFSMGEGGALVVNDPALVERAEIIREKGTNRKQFRLGLADKYRWVDIGASYVASELLAAMLWAQLLDAARIQASRHAVWRRYVAGLHEWASAHEVVLPSLDPWSCTTSHVFFMLLPDEAERDRFLRRAREHDIGAVFHYLPLAESPFGSRFASPPGPVTAAISARLVRLPLYTDMRDDEVERVIEVVTSFSRT